MGLLLGLVLVAVNLQGALEFVLMHLLLFWETRSMKILLRKNMTVHKKKNQLTAIIYALTLGCIIFLLTSANLQIDTINQISTMSGPDIVIEGKSTYASDQDRPGLINKTISDNVLQRYADKIKDFAYLSNSLADAEEGGHTTVGSNLARLNYRSGDVYAINPSKLIDANMMLNYHDRGTKLGETE